MFLLPYAYGSYCRLFIYYCSSNLSSRAAFLIRIFLGGKCEELICSTKSWNIVCGLHAFKRILFIYLYIFLGVV